MMILLLTLPVWRIAHVQEPPGGGSTGLVISWHDVPQGTTRKNIDGKNGMVTLLERQRTHRFWMIYHH
jgi:hypothetical protein